MLFHLLIHHIDWYFTVGKHTIPWCSIVKVTDVTQIKVKPFYIHLHQKGNGKP